MPKLRKQRRRQKFMHDRNRKRIKKSHDKYKKDNIKVTRLEINSIHKEVTELNGKVQFSSKVHFFGEL